MIKDTYIATIVNLAAMLGQCQEDSEDTEKTLDGLHYDLDLAQSALTSRDQEVRGLLDTIGQLRTELAQSKIDQDAFIANANYYETRARELAKVVDGTHDVLQETRLGRQYRLIMNLLTVENNPLLLNLLNYMNTQGQKEWDRNGATVSLIRGVRAITHWGLVESKTFVQDYYSQTSGQVVGVKDSTTLGDPDQSSPIIPPMDPTYNNDISRHE